MNYFKIVNDAEYRARALKQHAECAHARLPLPAQARATNVRLGKDALDMKNKPYGDLRGYKLCKGCGMPILKKGQKRKHPDAYRHAQGCPLERKKS